MQRLIFIIFSHIAMASLATVEHLKHEHELEKNLMTTLLVMSSSSFILFHAVGFNVIPMLLVGELCPVKLKSITSGITIAVVGILVFIVVKVCLLVQGSIQWCAIKNHQDPFHVVNWHFSRCPDKC